MTSRDACLNTLPVADSNMRRFLRWSNGYGERSPIMGMKVRGICERIMVGSGDCHCTCRGYRHRVRVPSPSTPAAAHGPPGRRGRNGGESRGEANRVRVTGRGEGVKGRGGG